MNQSKRYITSGVFSHERPQGTHVSESTPELGRRTMTEKQTTGYPVIDEILDSLRPQAQRTATNDRELALDGLAFELCYQAIRQSGLYTQLENHEWDALAERLRGQVRAFVDEQIDAELTRIEALTACTDSAEG